MAKNEWNAWVDSSDGLASVLVGVEFDGNEYGWGYDFGDEYGNVHDSGYCYTLSDAVEAVAQSLCEVGFDTTTDLVLAAIESKNKSDVLKVADGACKNLSSVQSSGRFYADDDECDYFM